MAAVGGADREDGEDGVVEKEGEGELEDGEEAVGDAGGRGIAQPHFIKRHRC